MEYSKKISWLGVLFLLGGAVITAYVPSRVIDMLEAKYRLLRRDTPLELGLGLPALIYFIGAVLIVIGIVLLFRTFVRRKQQDPNMPAKST